MRVIIIVERLRRCGKERRLVELLKGFSKTGILEIFLVILNKQVQFTEIYGLSNVKTIIFPRRFKKDFLVFFKILKICLKFRPDIIHSWGGMPSIYVFTIAFALRIKFINAMISNALCEPYSQSWWRSKITFPFSDVIVSNSYAGEKAYNVPKHKAVVIHNGFDFDRIKTLQDPQKIRDMFHIKTEYVVGMIGTFDPRKDYDTFIKSAKMLINVRNDITFLAVGTGPDIEKYKKSLDVKYFSNIIFTGQQEDVESIINIFNIGILITNPQVAKEGISNSIMEYMALGKPVIANSGGGTSEIILDKVTGFIIDNPSPQKLMEAIEYLISHPDETQIMGIRGKERIKRDFNIENMVNSTLELYQKLLVR